MKRLPTSNLVSVSTTYNFDILNDIYFDLLWARISNITDERAEQAHAHEIELAESWHLTDTTEEERHRNTDWQRRYRFNGNTTSRFARSTQSRAAASVNNLNSKPQVAAAVNLNLKPEVAAEAMTPVIAQPAVPVTEASESVSAGSVSNHDSSINHGSSKTADRHSRDWDRDSRDRYDDRYGHGRDSRDRYGDRHGRDSRDRYDHDERHGRDSRDR